MWEPLMLFTHISITSHSRQIPHCLKLSGSMCFAFKNDCEQKWQVSFAGRRQEPLRISDLPSFLLLQREQLPTFQVWEAPSAHLSAQDNQGQKTYEEQTAWVRNEHLLFEATEIWGLFVITAPSSLIGLIAEVTHILILRAVSKHPGILVLPHAALSVIHTYGSRDWTSSFCSAWALHLSTIRL